MDKLLPPGSTGIALDLTEDGSHLDIARDLERLGYDTLWIAGGQLDRLDRVSEILAATESVRVATGIVSLGVYQPADVAAVHHELAERYPGRFVLGLGAAQQPRALSLLDDQFAQLDALGVPARQRLLAALGPRKMARARDRADGAITLLVTPESTALARRDLGAARTLVVDQFVVVDADADRARAAIRTPLGFLATVGGYRASFLRMGFSREDVECLSGRLVDATSAWGEPEKIAERVAEHRAAGADHVALSVLGTAAGPSPLRAAEILARRLGLAG